MPDTPEYLQAIGAATVGKDFLTVQRETPALLAELTANLALATLTQSPAPGKWSIAEILAHLAEDEIVTHWRYRQMIESNGAALPGFDQDLWARLGDYKARDPRQSLELFRLLREANLLMLSRLTAEELQRGGVHSERGPITVESLARHMAGHDLNHLAQIRNILSR